MSGAIRSLLVIFMVALPCWAGAEDVYIWTDKNGVTHIEEQAPEIAPDSKIKVEKHTFEKPADISVAPSPNASVLTPAAPPEESKPAQVEQGSKDEERLRQEAIDKARGEYEEANANKERYLYKYKNADNSKARHYWKEKLDDLEEKRQKLEELEKAE